MLRTTYAQRIAQRLIGRRVARNDVGIAAESRQRNLDTGARGLTGLDEDQPQPMRNDHGYGLTKRQVHAIAFVLVAASNEARVQPGASGIPSPRQIFTTSRSEISVYLGTASTAPVAELHHRGVAIGRSKGAGVLLWPLRFSHMLIRVR